MEHHLNLSDEDEVVGEASRPREESSDSGSVLLAVANLTQEVKDRFKQLEDQVAEIVQEQMRVRIMATEKSQELKAGIESLKASVENIAASGTQDVRTKRVSSMQLRHLLHAVGPERAVLPLLTWAIICTVHGDVFDNSQGLAMILFSAKNNSKVKLATPPGRIWLFLIRRALRSGIIFAKTNLFRKGEGTALDSSAVARPEAMGIPTSSVSVMDSGASGLPREPEWLMRFKTNSDVIRAVDDAMQKFEGTSSEIVGSSTAGDSLSEGPSSRPRKRRKSSNSAPDADHEFRKDVVKHIRSLWLEKMNHGRTAVRAYLYKTLVFILDKISQFKDVDVAARKGYKIVLGKEASFAEKIEKNSANVEAGIWNVPDAYVAGVADANNKNLGHLDDLKDNFPSLHATIVYRKHIRADRNEEDPLGDLNTSNQEEYISVTEQISLHEVANEMLMELFSCPDRASVLRVSQLSLKATHVLAIALRGLVVNVLNQISQTPAPLSEMEAAAFGTDVSLDDEKTVSVMMEKYMKNGRGKVTDTYASCYRDKFTITEDDAQELRKKLTAEEAQNPAEQSLNPRALPADERDDEEVEDWIKWK